MPNLSQCLPVINIVIDKNEDLVAQCMATLDSIQKFVREGKKLFGSRLISNDSMVKMCLESEKSCVRAMWELKEHIPKKYAHSSVKFNWGEPVMFPEAQLSAYPVAKMGDIIDLADKLNMVIVPLDYVDIHTLINNMENAASIYGGNYHHKAIDSMEKNIKEANIESTAYILCPLSYYNFWLEIKSDKNIPKYAPQSIESIFTTIDLMVPAQRNLYAMSKANQDNNKNLAASLKENVEQINTKLKSLENRVSNVEAQMEQVIRQQREAEEQIKNELKLREAQLSAMRYSMLDPLVFFTVGKPVDFYNKSDRNKKAHLVSCFGPEFPIEFFTLNGVTIHSEKDCINKAIEKYNRA